MKNNEELKTIVSSLIDKLKEVPEGYDTTTYLLLGDAGYDAESFDDEDLMNIHSELFNEASSSGLNLDMSAHFGKFEGLPYDLDYIVKKTGSCNEDTLLKIKIMPSRSLESAEITVFDREENNMVVLTENITADSKEVVYSLPAASVEKIKDLLKDPSLMLDQEADGYVAESGIIVNDGANLDVELYIDGSVKHFSYYELETYRDHLGDYPQTRTVYEIYSFIEKEIRNSKPNNK